MESCPQKLASRLTKLMTLTKNAHRYVESRPRQRGLTPVRCVGFPSPNGPNAGIPVIPIPNVVLTRIDNITATITPGRIVSEVVGVVEPVESNIAGPSSAGPSIVLSDIAGPTPTVPHTCVDINGVRRVPIGKGKAKTRLRKATMPKRRSGITVPRVPPPPETNPRRKKRKNRVLKDIKDLQKTTHTLIKKLPFQRLVREIAPQFMVGVRFQSAAIGALQATIESYITDLFTDAGLLAKHAGRVTVMPRDIQVARRLNTNQNLLY
ncbi:unnamed protein product [Medioppia subpectinata]|uniref:Core Histone H2A/H2B/H3 domain-containing protein n=1 Tax=Medioppia subpectinata TaxID=1979941 RepID=A0A7R9PWR6_9ACAR|nr:unnamed protein product [Medioppia subpectinata]CAG2104211.1 unnamed protein product [Medioppia subpectinata]